jgi:hypothetical protein
MILIFVAFSAQASANDYGNLGMEAYRAADYGLAEGFLRKGIYLERLRVLRGELPEKAAETHIEPWVDALAHIYWETGSDHFLLDYAETELSNSRQEQWWCRVLERRGHLELAEDCWSSADYENRTKRTIRSRMLFDTFLEQKIEQKN